MTLGPGATLGLIGGGQLARMFALEARRMGFRTRVLDPDTHSPAAQVADTHVCAPLDDLAAAGELARACDVVTLEWENADVATLRQVAEWVPVHPDPGVLEIAQHRVREKDTVRRLGIPTAEYRAVGTVEDLRAALAEIGTPAVLKTARGGYDGRGQVVVRSVSEAEEAFRALTPATEMVLEAFVPFQMEVSVICARNARGQVATFPIAQNAHVDGILDVTVAPARIANPLERSAHEIGRALAEGLEVTGLLAVEMFVTCDGQLLVNELAPRPHNSGHYTWEACAASQFEQQLRAVCGLPLASTELLRPAAMANLLGDKFRADGSLPGTARALATPGVAMHLYGKRQPRPGRKMGHLTALAATADQAEERVRSARNQLGE
ncbi:MAG: 5-(carboxyamino)imidazole ribonucleotide synthase [Gemmatimonadetes bacterium]|nr:5-(carboxyamino)imidazole ribonucleotide synthase [Gemmatimonadota bacterium]